MTDQSDSTYPSPLQDYTDLDPLPDEKILEGPDAKSYKNPQHGVLSPSYEHFTDGILNASRGGFDVHVYFLQTNVDQVSFAQALWERIRRQFPELRIYSVFERPIGPHPVGMFEVNVFTPAQFGAFIPWLVINRGPLSVLIHPNTEGDDEDERNHTERATWMGERLPLDISLFKRLKKMKQAG